MKFVIITGTTGRLGAEYLKYFQAKKEYKCLTIIRRKPLKLYKNVDYQFANLLNNKEVTKAISEIDFTIYSEVIFIHPIGMFKFEKYGKPVIDRDKDGIDDEIFASNVKTFQNIFLPLKRKIKKEKEKGHDIKFTIFAFGSITDDYNIPFWQSYSKSKHYLKKIIKDAINENVISARGVFVNVSTVDTGNERNLRPYAKRKYWLTPQEIVKVSLKILNEKKNKWTKMSLYKAHPKFDPTWYTNHENVLKRWENEMGLSQNP